MPTYQLETRVDKTSIDMFGRDVAVEKAKEIIRFHLHRQSPPVEPVWSEHPHVQYGVLIPDSFLVRGEIAIPDYTSVE